MKRLIGILGASYCGSTVFGYTLGALPECTFMGETYWITQTDLNCTSCTIKKQPCSIITEDLRTQLKNNEGNYFKILADKCETDNIISTDKSVALYKDKIKNIDTVWIILFKSPWAQVTSHINHTSTKYSTEQYLNVLNNHYTNCVSFAGNALFIDFDFFSTNREQCLEYICNRLNLKYTADAIRYWNFTHHSVSGNTGAYTNVKDKINAANNVQDINEKIDWYKAVYRKTSVNDSRWKFQLSSEDWIKIGKHQYFAMYHDMLSKFSNNFMEWAGNNAT